MAKLRWGNGETNTGENPYLTERGASSDLESYDRVNIKDGKRKPHISFEELADKFHTDSQHLLNALKNHDVIIENPSDMLTKEEAEFILHTFSSAYKEDAKKADRATRAEERRKIAEARAEKNAELSANWQAFFGKPLTQQQIEENKKKYKDLLE
ncbi:MAG: hypothetical protein LUM44_05895 [Pyrinomonadaceae bacterium]|nr:hypothetical protein [Pyrinomonadaceae bacterium]